MTDGGVPLRAVAFGLQDAAPPVGARVALVFEVERREWDGEVRIELCVRDLAPSG